MVAIVQIRNALAELVKQPNKAQNRSGDFASSNIPVCKNRYIDISL